MIFYFHLRDILNTERYKTNKNLHILIANVYSPSKLYFLHPASKI